ncbi:MAG: tripartite tricarboxylate transporter permease [Candidatus Eremiobacteraeota bacterium]|nr:tripartite tricarboxylate transporter permease [Candidatus Eremiobacteraeota bacterium]
MLDGLASGFHQIFTLHYLWIVLIGSAVGIAAGATPGMSTAGTLAILIPFTFTMDAVGSLALLASVYTGAQYGGSISATLLNTPGAPESAVITFDGYPLTQQGKAGKALTALILAGLVGGLVGTIVLVLAVVPLAKEALRFGPAEMFALAIFGITVVGGLVQGGIWRGLAAASLGLLVMMVGQDPVTGTNRFTLGSTALLGGIPFIPALIGLFALSEVFLLAGKGDKHVELRNVTTKHEWAGSWSEFRTWIRFMLVGAAVGIFVAVHPGGGATIASLIAYSVARQMSKNPGLFGKGAIEGIITPEAADKATVGAAMIPLLGLGIPGSASSAVLIGAFTLHGIEPGPMIFKNHVDIVWALFAALFVANFMVFALGFVGVPLFARVTLIPRKFLMAAIVALCFVGAYANGSNMLAVWTALAFGIIGFLLRRAGVSVAPIVLGLVLGPLLETNLRQAMIISNGNWLYLLQSPIALFLYALGLASALWPVVSGYRKKRMLAAVVAGELE